MSDPKVLRSDPTPGQYITELHVWIATYPDGTEGIIAGGLEGIGMTPLMSSRRDTAEALAPKAREAQRAVMHKANHMTTIRLVTFRTTEARH